MSQSICEKFITYVSSICELEEIKEPIQHSIKLYESEISKQGFSLKHEAYIIFFNDGSVVLIANGGVLGWEVETVINELIPMMLKDADRQKAKEESQR